MKSVYREKLFYGIQHLENFLLTFFLVPHRAVPDLQRIKRPFSDAIFFYIWRPSRMFYALVSIQRRSLRREAIQSPQYGFWIAEPAIGPARGRTRWAPKGASQ